MIIIKSLFYFYATHLKSRSYYDASKNESINNVKQSNVDFNYFLKSKKILKKIRWDNNFGYRNIFLDNGQSQNLLDLSYTSNFVYTKNLKNFLLFNARFNYRSEMQDGFSGQGLFPTFSFGYMRQSQTNKAIRWAAGVNYNNDFNRNSVIPFLMFNYETAKIKFNATLPNSILFLVKHKPTFVYGANATLNASIFNVEDPNVSYLKLVNANFYGFIQTKIYDKLWLDVKPGITILRTIDGLNGNFKSLSSASENKLENRFVLNAGLIYKM
jgi:hypothetical protein